MKNYITRRKQFYYSGLLLVVSFAFHFIVHAQKLLECPEPKVSKEYLARMKQQIKNMHSFKTQSGSMQIRVFAHIVENDDGTLAGATPDEILQEIETMKSDFAPADICFVYVGYNRITSTLLNNINVDTHDDEEDLFEPHLMPKCLNIFYTHQIRGKNPASGGGYGGITFSLPNTWCLVANGSLGRHTSSHETGHCFGLLHTFDYDRNGYENINGDDCDDLGDLMCDTKADPYSYRSRDCFSTNSDGDYTGYCTDPNGQNNFSPPYNNIMSYWHHAPESFTLDQRQFMDVNIIAESELEELTTTQNDIFFAGVNHVFEIDFESAKNSITAVGVNKLLQASQTALIAKMVIIGPGFHAKPSVGYTLLKANECSGFSSKAPIAEVQTTQRGQSVVINKIQSALKVYPNPATNYFVLQYTETNLFDAVVNIRNSSGVIIYSIRKSKTKELNEKINISGKAKGVYLIEVVTDTKRITQKLVLQ